MLTEEDKRVMTKLIHQDMKSALGVTEPGAIAFAVAKAKSYVAGTAVKIVVSMNSGMYKNAFTCGIPNSNHVGAAFSAALGFVDGNPYKGLEALADVVDEDNEEAQQLIESGKVQILLSGISSQIFIEAAVTTEAGTCTVTIRDAHTNIVQIICNGKTIYQQSDDTTAKAGEIPDIHDYSLADMCEYARTVDSEDIAFIDSAYNVNLALFEAGLQSSKTTFVKSLFHRNSNRVISRDELATAQLLCNGAIEARVLGLNKPAMSITGSGAHGIICTLPLYAVYKIRELSDEKLLRATALSYLITMYIKEYSGRLSAFCGCAIAAGTGMACALIYLMGGTPDDMKRTINNMASSITGMICDGGNHGCTMKGIVAVDAAFRSVRFAMDGISIEDVHGINGKTAEDTFRYMGRIASPGMTGTEETIVNIFKEKSTM